MVSPILRTVFNGFIDNLAEQVQEVIATGDNALAERMIQAEQSVTSLIDYGREAYKSLLDYSITRLTPEAQNFVNQVETLVNGIVTKQEDVLDNIATKVQQVANTFLFANLNPQVSSIKPRYFVIDDASAESLVTFEGNFAWPKLLGTVCWWYGTCSPTLEFGDKTCTLQDQTTQKLSFLFPTSIFGIRPDDNKFYLAKGELKVPFERSPGLLLEAAIGKVADFFTYHITLVALPRIAGSGIASFSSLMQRREVRPYKQEPEFAGNGVTVTKKLFPDPGFQFVKDSYKGKFLKDYNLGEVNFDIQPHCITASIHCARGVGRGGGPGHAIVLVTCDQERFTTVENPPREEPFELTWHTDRLITPRNGERFLKLIFNDCRGHQFNFSSPREHDNLKFRAIANGAWELRAEKPTDLNFAFPS